MTNITTTYINIIDQFLEEETLTIVMIDHYKFTDLDDILLEYIIEQTLNKYPQLIKYLCKQQEVINRYSQLDINEKHKDMLTQYLVTRTLQQQEEE